MSSLSVKFAAILTIMFSLSASAAEFLEFRDDDFQAESVKDKKWQITAGVEYLQYTTNLPEFSGEHENIKENEDYNIFGLSLGFGRSFDLYDDFSTTVKIGGFYTKTLDKNVGKAGDDIDIDLASTRSDHMVYGGEATISLNYLFENKYLNFQPFVEFGGGTGVAEIQKEYTFEGIQSDQSDAEDYDVKVDENFTYAKTSIGVNFISRLGVLSYIKVTQMILNVTKSEFSGSIQGVDQDGEGEKENRNLLAASIGFGYLF